MKKEDLEDAFAYIKSKECQDSTKKNMLFQVTYYLNNKYPDSLVTLDAEREIIKIEGEQKEDIFNDLREIGLI